MAVERCGSTKRKRASGLDSIRARGARVIGEEGALVPYYYWLDYALALLLLRTSTSTKARLRPGRALMTGGSPVGAQGRFSSLAKDKKK